MTGWCRLWIDEYGLMVRPLYEMLKASTDTCLEWTEKGRSAFRNLKQALLKAPALALPNLEKPFELFAREKREIALGVLTQLLEPLCRAAVYFSKQLDTVSQGWPGCLKTAAATVILTEESRKLTLGQKITVDVPHTVITVLEQKGERWLAPSQRIKYLAVLLDQDDTQLKTTAILNPAAFFVNGTDERRRAETRT